MYDCGEEDWDGKTCRPFLVGPMRSVFLVWESFTWKQEEWNSGKIELLAHNFWIDTKFLEINGTW